MRCKLTTRPLPGYLILVFIVSAVVCQPAHAQGFLESIFGLFSPKKPSAAPRIHPTQPLLLGEPRPANPFGSAASSPAQLSYKGRYKTVCVRLCDGYYFPISSASSRRQFYEDSQQCTARCDGDVRLFYMSRNAASIDGARDIAGGAYDKLVNAYRYRKALVKGCECRPKPWSVSERMRHQDYAMAEARAHNGDMPGAVVASAEAVGGVRDDKTVAVAEVRSAEADETIGVPEPQPVTSAHDGRYQPVPPMPIAVSQRRLSRSEARRPRRQTRYPQQSWGLGGGGLLQNKSRYHWPGDSR